MALNVSAQWHMKFHWKFAMFNAAFFQVDVIESAI
jgi:hypothetical protein